MCVRRRRTIYIPERHSILEEGVQTTLLGLEEPRNRSALIGHLHSSDELSGPEMLVHPSMYVKRLTHVLLAVSIVDGVDASLPWGIGRGLQMVGGPVGATYHLPDHSGSDHRVCPHPTRPTLNVERGTRFKELRRAPMEASRKWLRFPVLLSHLV